MAGPLSVPVTITFNAADPGAGDLAIEQLCIQVLPGWASLKPEELKITKISGGISNILVKVSPPSHARSPQEASAPLKPVAVKVFGDKTELLIDREAELRTLVALNKAGFGAQVLVVFENGRIEEFLTAATLLPEDVASPVYLPRIARKLRQLHSVKVPGAAEPLQPALFPTFDAWIDLARGLSFEDPAKQQAYEQLNIEKMAAEVRELRALCEEAACPVVFCHNDLLPGNILVVQREGTDVNDRSKIDPTGDLQFIDFEYSVPGYRGFDWGNHFNEYAGFDCDYSKYPGREQQARFFSHYMAEEARLRAGGEGSGLQDGKAHAAQEGVQLSVEEVERLGCEADLFSLASHAYWGIWALVQARYSPIEFDYLDYSRQRWAEYQRRKEPVFRAARTHLLQGAGAQAAAVAAKA